MSYIYLLMNIHANVRHRQGKQRAKQVWKRWLTWIYESCLILEELHRDITLRNTIWACLFLELAWRNLIIHTRMCWSQYKIQFPRRWATSRGRQNSTQISLDWFLSLIGLGLGLGLGLSWKIKFEVWLGCSLGL